MSSAARIALIHATPAAIDPIIRTMAEKWPEAEAANVLDDSLSPDRAREADISPRMTERILTLARYGASIGSAGILFTCSAFGPAIEAAAAEVDVPVLKPNEAMFEAAFDFGPRIAMLATFAPAVATMEAEFTEEAARRRPEARLTTVVADGAMAALRAGNADEHNRLVAERARGLRGVDAIMLAHFSTSRAADAVRRVTDIPVLTSPDAAVDKLKRLLSVEAQPARVRAG